MRSVLVVLVLMALATPVVAGDSFFFGENIDEENYIVENNDFDVFILNPADGEFISWTLESGGDRLDFYLMDQTQFNNYEEDGAANNEDSRTDATRWNGETSAGANTWYLVIDNTAEGDTGPSGDDVSYTISMQTEEALPAPGLWIALVGILLVAIFTARRV